jgi:hypothetical protein
MIRYFRHVNGFLAIDTTMRVQQAPGFLYGKCAEQPGDVGTIIERVWDPTTLGAEIPPEDVPTVWLRAFGFTAPPPLNLPPRLTQQPWRGVKPPPEEEINLLPGKSYLVPLMPLDEYEAWMIHGCEDDVVHRVIDVGFPWDTAGGAVKTIGFAGLLLLLLLLGVA